MQGYQGEECHCNEGGPVSDSGVGLVANALSRFAGLTAKPLFAGVATGSMWLALESTVPDSEACYYVPSVVAQVAHNATYPDVFWGGPHTPDAGNRGTVKFKSTRTAGGCNTFVGYIDTMGTTGISAAIKVVKLVV